MILFNLFFALLAFVCPPEGYVEIPEKDPVPILTPALKERKTAKLRLCNGLGVYIISDPGANQSAASLAVNAGSWLDGPEYPGIAHFLEHLLFLGNAAYPEEDEFMSFVGSNGGTVNAYTASDRTVYAFSINNNAFNGGLDRFAHFFIDPLFDPSGVGRELHAVDQESAKNIQNDGWRWWMIFKQTGNPNSPNAPFSTGNAQTLGHIPPAAVKKWWEDHYSADQMHLVIYSNQSLETLKPLIAKTFGPIEKRDVQNHTDDVPLVSTQQLDHITYIEPVQDIRDLTLTWELPTWAIQDLGAKLPSQIAYILSNGSDNGLEATLKKQQLAESVSADVMRLSDSRALFMLSVELTSEGVRQHNTVIQQCFDAIAQLKSQPVPHHIFDNLQQMALTNYSWQTRTDPFMFVQEIARQLTYEPLATYPEQTIFYTAFEPKKLHNLIDALNVQTCAISLAAPKNLTHIETDQVEKWYGAAFTIQPLQIGNIAPNPSIGMPKSNPFIPTNLKILPKSHESPKPTSISPSAYYTPAQDFLVPEISWTIGALSPMIDGSPKNTALLDLYVRALNEKLSAPLFFSSYAGLNATITQDGLKFYIQLAGYSEKAPLLLQEIATSLKTVHPTEKEFATYKESLLTSYSNQTHAMPFRQAISMMASVLYNDAPAPQALYAALQPLSYDDFLSFADALFQQVHLETLFAGNLSKNQAQQLLLSLKQDLQAAPYPNPKQPELFLLNPQNGPYAIPAQTKMQGNATMLAIEQGDASYATRAAQEVLGTALSDDFFKTLRTQQQTGYIAKGFQRDRADQLLQYFIVQSATHSPDDLLSRFELFLEGFVKDFQTSMPPSRFDEVQKGVITTLTNPPNNLYDYATRQYTFAFKYHGDFDYLDNVAAAAKAMTYNDAHSYAQQFFSRKNRKRLAILLEGSSGNTHPFIYNDVSVTAIRSEGQFSQ